MFNEKLSGLISAENSVEFQKQLNLFSQDLNLKIKATVKQVVESIEKLNIDSKAGKQALLSLCNCFVEHLGTTIFRLQNFVVINLQENVTGKQELIKLIGKFVETSYSVQHFFNNDSKGLKHKLMKSVEDVMVETDDIMKIIGNEELIGNKMKLIDELSNLLRTLDCIGFYANFLNNSTLDQIKQLFDEFSERFQPIVDSITDDNNKIVLYHFVHSVNTGCQHMQKVVHYMERYASQFDNELYKVVMATSRELHNLLVEIQELLYKSADIKLLRALIRKNVSRGCVIFGALEKFLQNIEVTDCFKEVVYAACSNSLACGHQLQRGLENLSRFTKMKQ